MKTLQSKYYKAKKLVIFFSSSGSKWKEWLSHLSLLTAGMCHDCVWVKNTFHLHMKDRKASTKGQGDNTYVAQMKKTCSRDLSLRLFLFKRGCSSWTVLLLVIHVINYRFLTTETNFKAWYIFHCFLHQ